MTREQAIRILQENKEDPDVEMAHSNADDVLCELLISLGYQDVIDEWNKVPKWYA